MHRKNSKNLLRYALFATAQLTLVIVIGSGLNIAVADSGTFSRFLTEPEWAVSTTEDPTGLASQPFVQRFELRTGHCQAKPPYNDCKSGTERAELAQTEDGSSRQDGPHWYRWQFYIPEEFGSSYPAKNRFGQFIDSRTQKAAWVLELGRTGVLWLGRLVAGDSEYLSLLTKQQLLGQWQEVIVQATWSKTNGVLNMWINGEQIVRYQGQTCDKCDVFFSYGIARIGVEKFAKHYPEKPLPDQIVFYSPVEISLGDPGWVSTPDPVDDALAQEVSPESSDLNGETHADTETQTNNLPTAASLSEEAPGNSDIEDGSIEASTPVNDQDAPGDEVSDTDLSSPEEKVYEDVVIIIEEAEISTSTNYSSTQSPEQSEPKKIVDSYERANDRR
ncbi:heparin lyase I family protein [Arenicellales bacterium IMCC58067]